MGGLAVGEGQQAMFDTLDVTLPLLPADRPRYLMGVGRPADIVGAVKRGIDMFDCVLPTRGGRTAQAFTRRGELNLRNARHRDDAAADRRALRLPGLPAPQPRLPASSRARRGDSRGHAAHVAQSALLPGLMRGLRGAIETGSLENWIVAFESEQQLGDIFFR